mmetsp:Transcript_14613/g.43229  ORF Transcript_14613/g.43229 Transcript_14613/m.43229 type:complete len:87 (+) Transcript_14613:294-554(+)
MPCRYVSWILERDDEEAQTPPACHGSRHYSPSSNPPSAAERMTAGELGVSASDMGDMGDMADDECTATTPSFECCNGSRLGRCTCI